jgi:cystathionine beta-lyase
MDFDEIIDRRGTHSDKWDLMERVYGVSPADGIPMWVADMDFRPPASVQRRLEQMVAHGVYGYFGDDRAYLDAIGWWMRERHGWTVAPEAILTVHGLVNGTALCIEALTQPGDGVLIMTPVYHAFARVIASAGRRVVACPLAREGGRYVMDFDRWAGLLTGDERMLMLCSPHNPGGRVWTRDELRAVADFCRRHDLILVSDEIHHDLVFPGHRHHAMPVVAPDIVDRLVMLTAATKTFNIAGMHTGNVIVPDAALRGRIVARMRALGISGNAFGYQMAEAAYGPEGAQWVDALVAYLAGNHRLFNDGVAAIPGAKPMEMEGTYLCWVDFADTGLEPRAVIDRVQRDARIAASHGATFGQGGETFLRFNIATPRARVAQAVDRLRTAFADLQ